MKRGLVLLLLLAFVLSAGGSAARPRPAGPGSVEVVVTLSQPPLARASVFRALAGPRRKLSLRAPASVSYLRTLAAAQRSLAARIVSAIPEARVRWHYDVVLNGMAVVVPSAARAQLASVPGVAAVYPSVTYHALLDRSPQQIGAPQVWGPNLETAGNGMKIGIIDDGLDQTHPFFDPNGFTAPAGFPKGNLAYTTSKVIVARAFPPASTTWKNAALPFDPVNSEHATHVAGIAAGDHGVHASPDVVVSGVAPNAYIGNYKALTVPTPDVGLDGNSPEIAAAIEAAVRDGMDAINLSLGEPEVLPGRDLVTDAINGAAAAGVVPAVAAGNDYGEFGNGSVSSPGSAAGAITAAAVSTTRGGAPDVVASFSSGGPTPISLALKPDVSAPGVSILSSVPRKDGLWQLFSGTSMASPHVAASAALLRERHPGWTVAQVKSALVLTGDPVYVDERHAVEASTSRQGGGRIALARADTPLVFAEPSSLSFGLLRAGTGLSRAVGLTDAGGGAGDWTVSVRTQSGTAPTAPATVTVPGTLTVSATGAGPEGDASGYVMLTRGTDVRRIPYWFHVEVPHLFRERAYALPRTGTYLGDTRGKQSLVSRYRYPERTGADGVASSLGGPEQVFRVRLTRPAPNFGVALLSVAKGVRVEPRVVFAGDENRLVGYPGLPIGLNPYQRVFGEKNLVAGAISPAAGQYDIVFDTPTGAKPGRFAFRFWINDRTPPTIRVAPVRGGKLALAFADAGSGVDPSTIAVLIDGKPRVVLAQGTRLVVDVSKLSRGRHALLVSISDLQESKNMENVGPILPNTRTLRTTILVR